MCERTPTTVFDGDEGWFRANMNVPFCPGLRRALVDSARAETDRRVHDGAVNICVQGPHNETPAEIDAYRIWGADIICTTIYPEVVYFRELEMCYAGLAWLSDVAGVEDEADWVMITPDDLAPILRRAVTDLPADLDCQCQSTWSGAEEDPPTLVPSHPLAIQSAEKSIVPPRTSSTCYDQLFHGKHLENCYNGMSRESYTEE